MARKKRDPLRRRRRIEKLTGNQRLKRALFNEAFVGKYGGWSCGFSTRKLGKLDVCNFKSAFAAKHYFDLIIDDDEISWLDDNTVQTDNGLIIEGNRLREISEFKMARTERELFTLGESYHDRVTYIRSNRPYTDPPPDSYDKRSRNSRKGMILVEELAKDLNMNPKEFRSKLRRLGVQKPQKGWAWRDRNEANRMKAIVRRGTTNIVSVNFSRSDKDE